MVSQTNEYAFEAYTQQILLNQAGWQTLDCTGWDKELALFPGAVVAYLKSTQGDLWKNLAELHEGALDALVVKALAKELDGKGCLHVLRHGFKFHGKTLRMAVFKPAHGANYEVLEQYGKNRLTVTRQVPCHPGDGCSVDMLFALNGIPVATCELKNPGTSGTWREAVAQYKESRDPRAPLFTFKARALVHFAVDPHEVHMTTRLSGDKTRFLPFNRGSHPGQVVCGQGNPEHPSGYHTGYFWENVLSRDSFLDILGHFLFIERKEEKVAAGPDAFRLVTRETVSV